MFERFTDRARRIMVLAQEEARMLNHDYIGTEHILLGLIREGDGSAAQVLVRLGTPPEKVRRQVIVLVHEYEGAVRHSLPGPILGHAQPLEAAMKALVYQGPGKKEWKDVPDATIQEPADAVVRVDGFKNAAVNSALKVTITPQLTGDARHGKRGGHRTRLARLRWPSRAGAVIVC